MANKLFVGIMSGTSLDGIDTVVVEFDEAAHTVRQIARRQDAFPAALKQTLLDVIHDPDMLKPQLRRELDLQLAGLYSDSTLKLLTAADIPAARIRAIGCHGQTVNHQPDANPPFSIQLGDGQAIAGQTGITTVCDFRRADIEAGGQGAPLAPGFHEWAFAQPDKVTGVVNLGGIANITVLNPGADLIGYDTGPANTLLDLWCQQHRHQPYDKDGAWAASGSADEELIAHMLADDYFKRPYPKSTGLEYFNRRWLDSQLHSRGNMVAGPSGSAVGVPITPI
jgi:anhydro-N-acetylmuramic acid kinase